MRALGELSWFLGIRVVRDRNAYKIWLCQDSYILKIAAKFNIEGLNYAKTPLSTTELLPNDGQATPQDIYAYQQRVGSVGFAGIISRADVSYPVSILSQFLRNPSKQHLGAADGVILYLLGSKDLAMVFSGEVSTEIFLAASDAAFADDSIIRRSSDGYLFQLYGGPIDWRAGKQKTVTTSSTEAELLSLSFTAKEFLWWKRFFEAIQFDTEQEVALKCDNRQTIRILEKEASKLDTKLRHVDIHQHWLRQEVQANRIKLQWIATADMPADGLIKALPHQRHLAFIKQLNLVNIPHSALA